MQNFPRIKKNYLILNAFFSKILVKSQEKFLSLTCGNPAHANSVSNYIFKQDSNAVSAQTPHLFPPKSDLKSYWANIWTKSFKWTTSASNAGTSFMRWSETKLKIIRKLLLLSEINILLSKSVNIFFFYLIQGCQKPGI